MKSSSLCLLASLGLGVSLLACGDDGGSGGGGTASGNTSGAKTTTASASGTTTGGTESCVATFRWLQKDAYKETAGRTSALWPPHTTTTLTVSCRPDDAAQLEPVVVAVRENHGTLPGAVDVNGTTILVETKKEEVAGTRAELLDLAEAMQACECDPETKFLSLDALGDTAVQELVGTVTMYMQDNLVCASPGGVEAVVGDLMAGNIDAVLAALPSCNWASGTSFAEGLDEALTTLAAAAQESLDGYHVCNNDASLQAGLWSTFVSTRTVAACDKTAMTCHGPLWFYEP